MNIYKVINDEFTRIDSKTPWYNSSDHYFITCEGREMPELLPIFNFEPSTVVECMSLDQYIRFESFDGYDFTTFNYITSSEGVLKTFEINIYASKKYIILVFDRKLQVLNDLECNIISRKYNMLLKKGDVLDKIYFLIFDKTISSYFETLENIEHIIENIDYNILKNANKNILDQIIELKSKISYIRKNINPMVYIGDALLINDNDIISQSTMKYFNNLDLRINKLNDFSNNLRHLINETTSAYDSKISSITNDKTTLITIIAAFFAPPTVIAGIYGMNFKFMPELEWHYGYPFALFLMLAVSGIMYIILRIKKWI